MIADPSAPPVKLCKDCKHCQPGRDFDGKPDLGSATCKKASVAVDLVTGNSRNLYCTTMRELESTVHCGPEGKFFQPA